MSEIARSHRGFLAVVAVALFAIVLLPEAHPGALGQAQQQTPAQTETKPPGSPTQEFHFHHLHLNTLDPKAAIDFYTSKFDC